nr:MAG TPA: hypothetical protein [Caudoviricetes sp.]
MIWENLRSKSEVKKEELARKLQGESRKNEVL